MIDDRHPQQALDEIRENSARNGQHIYCVVGETCPRFANTIGVSESVGVELILAGAIFYVRDDVAAITRNLFGNGEREPWIYPIPEPSTGVTDLTGLRGDRITKTRRWEEEEKTSGKSLPTQDPTSRKGKCPGLPLERFWQQIRP